MRCFRTKLFFALLVPFAFWACEGPGDVTTEEQSRQDSLKAANAKIGGDVKGIAGLFDVPEMLGLCVRDSAKGEDIPKTLVKCFSKLEQERINTDAQLEGIQGIIYYNNNPDNFRFDCLLLIKKIPAKKPEHAQIVALNAGTMLIYNYYGPYEYTYRAYDEIKAYCAEHKLAQSGPMREFYPSSQSLEKDPNKLFTRIMLPVAVSK